MWGLLPRLRGMQSPSIYPKALVLNTNSDKSNAYIYLHWIESCSLQQAMRRASRDVFTRVQHQSMPEDSVAPAGTAEG
jgi:hypothetical protein